MKKSILFPFYSFLLFLFGCHTAQKTATTSSKNAYQQDQHRPQFHFSPPQKWMNDPNGMVYFKGEYHLFYQYYPDSTVWGPMHWGHAVSNDLMHWEHLPIALFPDKIGYIFSGSVVVDSLNTAGFQQKQGETPLVAVFTYHNMEGERAGRTDFQTQGIAYSLDKGRTWKKYINNPVINNKNIKDFRDPKVFWYQPEQKWVMTLAVADHVEFFASKNLKDWEKTGEFGKTEGAHGGVWECPDLFAMPLDETNEEKYVLLQSIGDGAPNGGSGTQYFIGTFDGKTFKNDNPPEEILWLDYGRDNYAGVTWTNVPNGRRLFLGWMSNWQYAMKVPTQRWRSAMTLPRTLSLRYNQNQKIRLFQSIVPELETIRGVNKPITVGEIETVADISNLFTKLQQTILVFDINEFSATEFGIDFLNDKGEKITIGYERQRNQYFVDRTLSGKTDFEPRFSGRQYAPCSKNPAQDKIVFNIILDVASVELLADNGETTLTATFFPNQDFTKSQLFSKGGKVILRAGSVSPLRASFFKN